MINIDIKKAALEELQQAWVTINAEIHERQTLKNILSNEEKRSLTDEYTKASQAEKVNVTLKIPASLTLKWSPSDEFTIISDESINIDIWNEDPIYDISELTKWLDEEDLKAFNEVESQIKDRAAKFLALTQEVAERHDVVQDWEIADMCEEHDSALIADVEAQVAA